MTSAKPDQSKVTDYVQSWLLSSDEQVTLEVQNEVEQFYFREARLQNKADHRQWLETMVDREVYYWLPVWEVRFRKDPRPGPSLKDPAIYNDTFEDLDIRIRRMETGMVWMEDPPARIRHMVTNIEAYHGALPGYYEVYSNVHVYRNRRQRDETNMYAGREDLLRRGEDGKLRLLRRKLDIDQRVVLDKNLNFFM